MHRHHRFRHGPRFFRPWRPFGGIFWLIILAMMFAGGRGWPIILVLIGLGLFFSSLFREERPPETYNPPPAYPPMTPPPAPTSTPIVVQPSHRADLLPATCPHCGGPIRAHEVIWTGAQTAACPYCASNLPMKKQ